MREREEMKEKMMQERDASECSGDESGMAGDDKPDLCETTSQISRKRLGMGQSL